jgi:hypothetical protein
MRNISAPTISTTIRVTLELPKAILGKYQQCQERRAKHGLRWQTFDEYLTNDVLDHELAMHQRQLMAGHNQDSTTA